MILERVRLELRRSVKRELLEQLELSQLEDFITGDFVVVLKGWFLCDKIEVPSSWWQMFKRDVLHTSCKNSVIYIPIGRGENP
jgi:hypothetical protein